MREDSSAIHRIELPVPFPMGTVNVYVVTDEPLTLVDTGVKTDDSLRVLQDALRHLGYGIEDIKRILITHGHVDHYGNAKRISTLSGAKICIHPEEHQRIQSIEQFWGELVSLLIQNGTPTDCVEEAIGYMRSVIRAMADPLDQVHFLDDGDEISFNSMVLRSILCPGHSPGLTCFYLEERGILLSGDHLLSEISPNPIVDISHDGPGPQSTSLRKYLDSLHRIRDMAVSLVLPGHGQPFTDFRGSIDDIFRHHERRLSMVLSALSFDERTAYEVSTHLFPHARSFEVFLAVSEVLGHLRILVDEGRIVFRSKGGIDFYSED